MSETALVLSGVCKQYGDVVAVDRLDLDIRPGELLALVGPSGSGKSTVLHLIAGMIPLDQGEIRLLGRDLNGVAPGLRDVAMVWQDGALYPHLTVAQNLAFPLKSRGKSGRRAVPRMAERLDIAHLLERRPAQLSGGERQRVALGRGLIRKPRLFMLDEPLSSLDMPLRDRMRCLIRDLVRETGVAALYVTHDQSEAMAVGDRVAVMNRGVVVQVDTPRRIYDEPGHEFVARFFGTPPMNLLDGRIEGARVVGPWGRLDATCANESGAVRVGFRPESASVSEVETAFPARLERLVYQGHETIAHFDAAGAEVRLRGESACRWPAPGETAYLRVEAGDLHLFAAESGKRL